MCSIEGILKSHLTTQCTQCHHYGVASVSRIDQIIGLFCKRALLKRRYSAKETGRAAARRTAPKLPRVGAPLASSRNPPKFKSKLDKPLEITLAKLTDGPLNFVFPLFGPTLMARGSFGAVRLAAVRPNLIDPTDRSHPIQADSQECHQSSILESQLCSRFRYVE